MDIYTLAQHLIFTGQAIRTQERSAADPSKKAAAIRRLLDALQTDIKEYYAEADTRSTTDPNS